MRKTVTYVFLLLFLPATSVFSQVLLKDIFPGSSTSAVDHLTPLNGFSDMVFIARESSATGVELFKSNGTTAGTMQVKDIYPGSNPSYPLIYHEYNGELYFRATNGTNGYELWKSDLTSAGTQLVKDVWVGSSNAVPLTTNGFVIAEAGGLMIMPLSNGTTNNGTELWTSDGTNAGTNMLVDIYTGTGSSGPKDFVEVNNFVYFTAYQYDLGTATGSARELWRTNGTVAGTGLIKDINPGVGSSTPQDLVKVGQSIIFSADDGTNGREVWISDGTTAGTIMLKDINPTASSSPEGFTSVGGEVFFFADDGTNGDELWKTDGTTAGTVIVKDINPGADDSKYIIPYYTEMGGKFYFNASDGVNGTEPWVSDGTDAGTFMLKDIRNGQYGSNPNGFYSHAGIVYMSAYTIDDGFELWATDGSETSKIFSFQGGLSCGCPADFTFYNGEILFTADNGSAGRELWTMPPLTDVFPVEFVSFSATDLKDGTVGLNWTTASETNNDFFDVERSIDGLTFQSFHQVDGSGNSDRNIQYTARDFQPIEGKNYYRIKQVDFNGNTQYSNTTVVTMDASTTFSISPNPVTEFTQVIVPHSEEPTILRVLDVNGRVVLNTQLASGVKEWNPSFSTLPTGIYFLEVEQDKLLKREKFLKD